MSLTRRRFLTICAASAMASPASGSTWRGVALGADASIEIRGEGSEMALQGALDTIRRMERLFSLYDPTSVLSTLNRTGRLEMPPEFGALMSRVDLIHKATGGLFDPTIQPKWRALYEGREPSSEIVGEIGWDKVVRRGHEISLPHPDMALTLNGIAQGFATDRVKAVLNAHGFEDVVVNVGEFAAGKGALIGVSNTTGKVLSRVVLNEAAIATSSPDALLLTGGYSHILGPKGELASTWSTLSVVSKTAVLADGLSTALCLCSDLSMPRALIEAGLAQKILIEQKSGELIELSERNL